MSRTWIALLSLVGAIVLTILVAVGATDAWDASVMLHLASDGRNGATQWVVALTRLATLPYAIGIAGAIAVCTDLVLGDRLRTLKRVSIGFVTVALTVAFLRSLIDREAPVTFGRAPGWAAESFPSGHAALVAMLASVVAIAFLDRCHHPWQRVGIVAAAVLAVTLMGWTRIYLGAHWPTDVLAGALFGCAIGVGVTVLDASWEGGSHEQRRLQARSRTR